jgi:hypothetical protein
MDIHEGTHAQIYPGWYHFWNHHCPFQHFGLILSADELGEMKIT